MRFARPARRILLLFPHPRDQRRATARRHATPLHGPARRLRVHPTFDHARSRRPDQRHARPNSREANHPSPAHSRKKCKERPLRHQPRIRKAKHGPRSPQLRPTIPNRTPRTRPTIGHVWRGRPRPPSPPTRSVVQTRSPSRPTNLKANRIPENHNASSNTKTKTPSLRENVDHRTSREAAKERAHSASRGTEAKNTAAPKERKNPRHESADDNDAKEYARIRQAQAAIPGALAGNGQTSEPSSNSPVSARTKTPRFRM